MTSFVARNIDPAAANAIHDDDVARSLGFAGALVPGVELFGRTCTALAADRLVLRFRRPVYDGERVDVEAGDDGDVVLRGPDGDARAVGAVGGVAPAVPDLARADLPGALPPPEPQSLPVGPLGTVEDLVDAARNAAYCAAVGETADAGDAVHPGLLLRAVNLVLMRNVALGPWIHTSSDVALLAAARLPARLEVRAAVRSTTTSRAGHDVVRYDAVVRAGGLPVAVVDHTAAYRLRT